MPSVWNRPSLSGTIVGDDSITLSDGRTLALSDVSGVEWDAAKIARLTAFVQAAIDDIQPVASLPDRDPDKTATPAELLAKYGGRRFLDGNGNIVSRSTLVTFEYDGTDLIATWSRVT